MYEVRAGARARTPLPVRFRRLVVDLRTEGSGVGRATAAVGLGVFIGCLPLYGLHLLICAAVGSLLGLNRLKVYLAANISNPVVAPWLLFLEIQGGAWLRRGSFHALSVDAVTGTSLAVFGGDLLVGSLAVGAALGALAAAGTFAVVRGGPGGDPFLELAQRAADRYAAASIPAWEFGRVKLRRDPMYRALLREGAVRRAGTLVDIGCGQGLTLALLAEARRAQEESRWPAEWGEPPRFSRLVGVETRPRVTALARAALAGDAEIVAADARDGIDVGAETILLCDVLQMMRAVDQDRVLAALAASLPRGGVIVVREADAAAGWRFHAVRYGNRLKTLAFGTWRQPFHFRSAREWRQCLERHGLEVEARATGGGTPFANVLFVARKR